MHVSLRNWAVAFRARVAKRFHIDATVQAVHCVVALLWVAETNVASKNATRPTPLHRLLDQWATLIRWEMVNTSSKFPGA